MKPIFISTSLILSTLAISNFPGKGQAKCPHYDTINRDIEMAGFRSNFLMTLSDSQVKEEARQRLENLLHKKLPLFQAEVGLGQCRSLENEIRGEIQALKALGKGEKPPVTSTVPSKRTTLNDVMKELEKAREKTTAFLKAKQRRIEK